MKLLPPWHGTGPDKQNKQKPIMLNSTAVENFTSVLRQEKSQYAKQIIIPFATINIFFSITAVLGNTLILISLRQVSSIHPPTKLLFRCLAVTDLSVGLIPQPLYGIEIMTLHTYSIISLIRGASSYILSGVTVLVSAAISADRLLALKLGLRYRHVVTLRRVRAAIIYFWLVSVLSVLLLLLVGHRQIIWSVYVALILFCVIAWAFLNNKIFLTLRQHQAQVQNHVHLGQPNREAIPLNIARFKKTLSSILWVQMTAVACYGPFVGFALITITPRALSGKDFDVTLVFTSTLVYLNSSLNPILYCWKITEIRNAIKDRVQQIFC